MENWSLYSRCKPSWGEWRNGTGQSDFMHELQSPRCGRSTHKPWLSRLGSHPWKNTSTWIENASFLSYCMPSSLAFLMILAHCSLPLHQSSHNSSTRLVVESILCCGNNLKILEHAVLCLIFLSTSRKTKRVGSVQQHRWRHRHWGYIFPYWPT